MREEVVICDQGESGYVKEYLLVKYPIGSSKSMGLAVEMSDFLASFVGKRLN